MIGSPSFEGADREDVLRRLREQLARYASNGTIGRLIRDAIKVIEHG